MASASSKRQVSGASNSDCARLANGLRDHSDKPLALQGTAKVMDSALASGDSGRMLPIQISSASAEPVASIFMPEITTPSSSSAITRQDGFGKFFFWKKSGSREA